MKKFVYITISDSRSQDSNIPDGAGLKIIEILEKKYQLIEKKIIPDDEKTIHKTLKDFINYDDLDLIVTTGGTGVSARDVTPEATKSLYKEIQLLINFGAILDHLINTFLK